MNIAFRWLQELMGLIVKLVPRPVIIRSTYGAVAFVRGKPRKINPGCWYWYWPIWTEIVEYPIVTQTRNLRPQGVLLAGRDGDIPVIVSGVVRYCVPDWFTALTTLEYIDTYVEDLAQGAIVAELLGCSLAYLISDRELNMRLQRGLQERIKKYGITIESFFLNTLTTGQQVNHMGIPDKLTVEFSTSKSEG